MINFGYHFARLQGSIDREAYRIALPWIARRPIQSPRQIDTDVFAYSNEAMLPEQVASIRSFLGYAGRPRSFTVVSDGSHSVRSTRLLRSIDPVVSVRPANESLSSIPNKFREYLSSHPTGKQLALIMSLPLNESAIYVDSDVRFFRGADDLSSRIARADAPVLYLPDCQFSGDERLVKEPEEKSNPVNTGFLILHRRIDWSFAVERFLEMKGDPTFFTNQTLTHLALHRNGARPLDPDKYVLQLDDQFIFPDLYASERLALRHYVNPVRHKFWTSLI